MAPGSCLESNDRKVDRRNAAGILRLQPSEARAVNLRSWTGRMVQKKKNRRDRKDSTIATLEARPVPPDHRFLDRELSQLVFNERVLALAERPSVPLAERLRFL